MVRPVAKTEASFVNKFIVCAVHTKFVDDGTQTPAIEKQWVRYYIQWQNIEEVIKRPFRRRFQLAQLQLAGVPYEPLWLKWYRFAVSYVGSTSTTIQEGASHATITNFTFSHDATGSDILVLGVSADSATTTVTATYNSASLTEAAKAQFTDRRTAWIGYKGSPSTGSNTVSVTYGTGTAGFGIAATYTGSNGTMNGGTTNTGTTQNFSLNVTTTSGDMAFDMCTCGGTQTVTEGAGQTRRLTGNDSYWHYARASEEAATGTTTTMSWTRGTGTANFAHAAANIVQASASSGPAGVKTWNGLATASTKTINGLAIASVKTKNGLA